MPKVFTVMPIGDASHALWQEGIQAACVDAGFQCDRADVILDPGLIVAQVYDAIASADVIIGEMTDRIRTCSTKSDMLTPLASPRFCLRRRPLT